jgi:hypothetical protein
LPSTFLNADGRRLKTCNTCRDGRTKTNKKLTINECKEFAENKGGECLSETYKNSSTKMRWKCSDNHEWETTFDCIKTGGTWCPHCAGLAKLTIDECREFAISKNGECLSDEYVNSSTKMRWRCSDNHEWEATFNNIKSGRWCPYCSGYKSEELCREIIEKYLLEKFPKKKPKFLEGLELDGYNEELNMAFEYNGRQHDDYIPHFHRDGVEDFERQIERDLKKYRICREMGVYLIIIPHQYEYKHPEELDAFIYSELCKIC